MRHRQDEHTFNSMKQMCENIFFLLDLNLDEEDKNESNKFIYKKVVVFVLKSLPNRIKIRANAHLEFFSRSLDNNATRCS